MTTETKAGAGPSDEAPWHAAYPEPRTKDLPKITREQLLERIKQGEKSGKGFVLIDVRRTDFEVCPGHGIRSIPLPTLTAAHVGRYDRGCDQPASAQLVSNNLNALCHFQSCGHF